MNFKATDHPLSSTQASLGSQGGTLQWLIKTKDATGHIKQLQLSNMTEVEVIRHVSALGLRVLSIDTIKASSSSSVSNNRIKFPILLFSQELLALLDAGLNLTEALSTLYAKERQITIRAILGGMLQSLQEGRNFSDVLAASPQHFSDIYVATIRASERTGDLPQALSRFIVYQRQFDTIRKKLTSALIYPSMLFTIGGLVTLFLLGYVVPKFSVVYESSGRDIPFLSKMLLSFGKVINVHWQVALLCFLSCLGLIVWTFSQARGRQWLTDQVLRLPWLASKANEFRLARFYRAVSLLLAAGISLPRAMGMVSGLLAKNQQSLLAQCRLAIEQGQSLSTTLVNTGLATPVAESLIKVGERSGQMAEMLERTASFADEDFARWVDWASRLLEPILMTIIGVVIGGVVLLMYMPIFDLAGSLQ